MTELKRHIGGSTVMLACDCRFEAAGNAVLRKLAELSQHGPALGDGSRVQFGWSVLTLRAENQALWVYEPDFRGDALHGLNRTLNLTLEIAAEQADVLRCERVEGVDARFDDYMTLRTSALQATDVFLMRRPSERPDDTGWFLGDLAQLENASTEEVEVRRIFEVFQCRRSIMGVLALPAGYAVTIRGDQVASIMRG